MEARRFAARGNTILLIGHEGHEEIVGTTGEAPDRTVLVQSPRRRGRRRRDDPDHVSYLSQTTLSVDETNDIIGVLRARFPSLQGPPSEDICYATQNRQEAVKVMAAEADVILVIGSENSSNSNRLVEVARAAGTPAYLVDDERQIDPAWLEGAETVGLTSGASAPEFLIDRVLAYLKHRGADRRGTSREHRGEHAVLASDDCSIDDHCVGFRRSEVGRAIYPAGTRGSNSYLSRLSLAMIRWEGPIGKGSTRCSLPAWRSLGDSSCSS